MSVIVLFTLTSMYLGSAAGDVYMRMTNDTDVPVPEAVMQSRKQKHCLAIFTRETREKTKAPQPGSPQP